MNILRTPDKNAFIKYSGYGILILVIAIYYITIQIFTINIPFGDEFFYALKWLDNYESKGTAWERFLFLFSQANEHRIFTFSLATISDYSLFGVVNFKRLAWEGNLFMVPLLFLINLLNTTNRRNPWIILPVAFLLFIPQQEITNWPIVAFGVILQFCLVIAALWMLARPGWTNLAVAVVLATIATFSFGNGMFTFAVGFLVLALKWPKKPLTWLVWGLSMSMAIFLYFLDYKFRGQTGLLALALHKPVPVVQYFLIFFGTILSSHLHFPVLFYMIAGLLPLLALGYLLIFKWYEVKKQPVALSILLFILISAAVAAISRQSYGIGGATAPRYVLLQAIYLAVLIVMYINIYNLRIKWLLPLFLGSTLLLYAGRFPAGAKALDKHQKHLKNIILAYKNNPEEINTYTPERSVLKTILDQSIRKGFYSPPLLQDYLHKTKPFKIYIGNMISDKVKFNIEQFQYHHNILTISGWAFSTEHYKVEWSIGLYLHSDKDSLVIPANINERKGVRQHFKNSYPDLNPNCGFSLNLDVNKLPLVKGDYKLGICLFRETRIIALKFTEKSISVNNNLQNK